MDYRNRVEEKLDSTMPWIGMYIAAASTACTLAMAADAANGFRCRKYWLPSNYFSLNAFSLTVLAIAMKHPVDLTSTDLDVHDKLARISSLVLLSAAITNFITSLASMENNEILLNLAALLILVITVAANVCIHIVQMRSFNDVGYLLAEQVSAPVILPPLLATLCCLGTMAPSARRYIELKYNELHKSLSNREVEWGEFTVDELAVLVKGYFVMAETGSPQFVVARSPVSCVSGALCLLAALTLGIARGRSVVVGPSTGYDREISKYGWSIKWIFYIQCVGVVVGTVAPLSRWFVASWFRMSKIGQRSFRDEVRIEEYWTSRLVEWRGRSLPFQVRNHVCKKLLSDAVRLFMNSCIGIQILIVSSGKVVLFISARVGNVVVLRFLKNSKRDGAELEFRHYVLLLEGEAALPDRILDNICDEADRLIQNGEKRQPKNLIRLLKKSADFNGVGRFDSSNVPSLHSEEPPNCWSLPVVTLTTISLAAASIADVKDEKANKLLASVGEGLSIVKLIEKTLDRNGELESIRKAADVVWVGVEVYRKWNYKDLESTSLRGATHKETLQNLSDVAEKIVIDFMAQTRDVLMQNPLNWPVRAIAANSMYRIAQTILLQMQRSDDELFESLCITISGIIAACLTNLVRVIRMKCHRNDVKERQGSVRRAAILLGERVKRFLKFYSNVSFRVWKWRKLLILMSGEHPWLMILKILQVTIQQYNYKIYLIKQGCNGDFQICI